MNKILSQDEINALLNGNVEEDQKISLTKSDNKNEITSIEVDAIGELANISMGSAATALSSLLGKRVDITTPKVSVTTLGEIKKGHPKSSVAVNVKYTTGIKGSNIFILHTYDAGVIADIMMGGDGSNPSLELSELHFSAISEAMNQMMGSSATSLSQILNKRINISSPALEEAEDCQWELFGIESDESNENDDVIKIVFRIIIENLVDSEMMQVLPISFVKLMINEMLNANNMCNYQGENNSVETTNETTTNETTTKDKLDNRSGQKNDYVASPLDNSVQKKVEVKPMEFSSLEEGNKHSKNISNLNLIMDVDIQLSVELGRTQRKIKDVLELTNGSIVELDKLAGEPVDILINGRLLAQGEVVVIDENFGVRVTGIITPEERIKTLR
ncbi:MAG: flagellar motor switch phosphatase FliY [Clostridia bacterium]|nr:flagellar motor switch phosphatase FliY [Clostridia bacterium]